MSSHNTFNRKRALVHENSKIFQCKYCPRTFSRRGAFRNHLRTHRDQMYLDENEEENPSEPRRTVISNALQRTVLSPILFNDIISHWNINDKCEEQRWNMNKNVNVIFNRNSCCTTV